MLTVYGRKSSFNLQKVMWLVGELQLPHNHIQLGGSFGGLDNPAFLQKNPHGRVPVIEDDGWVVWESHAILRYLAASYGSEQFWAESPRVRSQVDQWMDWSQCSLQLEFLRNIFWGYYRTPEPQRNMRAVDAAVRRTAEYLRLVDKFLGSKPYLLGDRISLADIAIGTNLFRYYNIEISRPSLPNVERWYESLKIRPAYQEHVMVPLQTYSVGWTSDTYDRARCDKPDRVCPRSFLSC